MEDLGMAVGEYGVNVKRGEFYRWGAARRRGEGSMDTWRLRCLIWVGLRDQFI
jgi:hypothetical protein